MSIDIAKAETAFISQFGIEAETIVRAPGRVNIIGEHTDYNHGYVLPMAIEGETVILARRRTDRILNAYAANMKRATQLNLDDRIRNPREPWGDYIIGVADELAKLEKPLVGADLFILGDVPIGCGLSSSASLEMAALTMFEALGHFMLEGAEAPKLGQQVENRFLGLSSGIMDQFISRMGKRDHALFLDCRSLEHELIPVAFSEAVFVISNTCVARGLTSSKYNERVEQCTAAVAGMNAILGKDGSHLRDYALSDLLCCEEALKNQTGSDEVFRRARHVITEDQRTLAACRAMRSGDAETLGMLMNESDQSLRDDYAVTCKELDIMTSSARKLPGCYGARMTGAGFGGCTINLVAREVVSIFTEQLLDQYHYETGLKGTIVVSSPADGASRIR